MSNKIHTVIGICKYSRQTLPYRNHFFTEILSANVCSGDGTLSTFGRFFSTTASKKSIFSLRKQNKVKIDIPKYGQLLDSWYYNVKPFGKLQIRSPMPVHIQPLDPQNFPKMDKVFVNIMYTGEETENEQGLALAKKQYVVGINLDDTNEEIEVDLRYKTHSSIPAVCDIQIPLKFDVRVVCTDIGDATLKKLESSSVDVFTDKGDCNCNNIKSGRVNIQSKNGNIISDTVIQGNLSLTTNNGDILAGKLQGQEVKCETGSGNMSIRSVYAEKSRFISTSGSIALNSCHGNSSVDMKSGDLRVDALDGSLQATLDSGSVGVYLAREGELNLSSNSGDVEVKIPHSLNSTIHLEGRRVIEGEVILEDRTQTKSPDKQTVTGNIGDMSLKVGKIQVTSKTGTIQLFYQDWFSSLNLGLDP